MSSHDSDSDSGESSLGAGSQTELAHDGDAPAETKTLQSALKSKNPLTSGSSDTKSELPPQSKPEDLELDKLSPLTPEIIARQATINIGVIGHVAHGKSTLVKAISGVQTVRFKNELVRNITIKLGYANAKIYKCNNPKCPRPDCFKSFGSAKPLNPPCERKGCEGVYELVRHVSFVDCPGHDILMSTMLSGAAVMDAALLIVAANETCPQPQTSEHLAAVEIMKLDQILILQNKVDLVSQAVAEEHMTSIRKFVRGSVAANAPIIPMSAQHQVGIDYVLDAIVNQLQLPKRDFSALPNMMVIRSFDVNKPGTEIDMLHGGVAGGSILHGVLKVGDEVEIRPGLVTKDDAGALTVKPLQTRILSLNSEANELRYAVPGGLIGVGTRVDPTLCRGDRLVGQIVGLKGKLPDVFSEIEVKFELLKRLIGVKATDGKQIKVTKLVKSEPILVSIGSTAVGARVQVLQAKQAKLVLSTPACTTIGAQAALSRRIDKHWRLIGIATVLAGTTVDLKT